LFADGLRRKGKGVTSRGDKGKGRAAPKKDGIAALMRIKNFGVEGVPIEKGGGLAASFEKSEEIEGERRVRGRD